VRLHAGIISGTIWKSMKKGIHPKNYREVIFEDASSGKNILLGSTIATKGTAQWVDGKVYPKTTVEISSVSHPFYTGKETVIDTAGRVEKFKRRLAQATSKQD
jgi:large subunit ribosomal protein L31